MSKEDLLGQRMKEQYEDRYRIMLPRRTYVIIRVDGKAFHTLTKRYSKPFDITILDAMERIALNMCNHIHGAKFAFVQSDEVSVLLTDFEKPETTAWFDNNLQKLVSVSASIATREFNNRTGEDALFDSRAFIIPDPVEVENYFIWRQKDARRNSIQRVAQGYYSIKDLHGKDQQQQLNMLLTQEVNWEDDFETHEKSGVAIIPTRAQLNNVHSGTITRFRVDNDTPIFTKQKDYLANLVPRQWADDLIDTEEMPEYDFSKAERGKFYRPKKG